MVLQLEDGRSLNAGPVLGGRAARAASESMRVLLHNSPSTEDISGSHDRLAAALSALRTDGELFSYWACIYSDGEVRVLVLEYLH